MNGSAKPPARRQPTSPRANWCDNWCDFKPTYGGDVIGWPRFVASFYIQKGPKTHTHDILDAWLELLPPKTKVRYAPQDETRQFFEHFDLTPAAAEQVREALSPARILEGEQWFQAYSDTVAEDCQPFSLEVFASAVCSYVYVSFPLDYVVMRGAASVVRWFSEWCERFEVTNGGAGFGYETVSCYDWAPAVGWEMLATGLRYHGVRVWERSHARFRGGNRQSLDTAAWLTFLDEVSISAVGTERIKQIDPGVLRRSCGSGLVLQAGPAPDPCDSIHPNASYRLLKSVNDAIVSLRPSKWGTNGWSGDVSYAAVHGVPALYDRENSWFSRMDADVHRRPGELAQGEQVPLASRAVRLLATLAWLSLAPGVLFIDPELPSRAVLSNLQQQERQFAKVIGELAQRPVVSGAVQAKDPETYFSAARITYEQDRRKLAVLVWLLVILQVVGWWLLYLVILPSDILAWLKRRAGKTDCVAQCAHVAGVVAGFRSWRDEEDADGTQCESRGSERRACGPGGGPVH